MPKLYELTSQYNQIFQSITESDSDLEQLEELLTNIEEEFDIKAENIAKLIRSLDGDIKAYKEEADRLATRKEVTENRQKRLKDYLETNMKAMGKENIKGSIFSLTMQNNPPKVVIDNEKVIPKKYKTYELHISQERANGRYKAGKK